MKKLYLTAFLLFGTIASSIGQSRFGIKGGLNLASEYIRIDNQSATTKLAASFHVGGYYDAAVTSRFSIQPGLVLQGKGGKSEVEGESLSDRLLYIEVPVHFIGRVPTRTGDFFFGGGPYFAYGVDARVTSGRSALHLEWGSGPQQIRPFDAGLSAILGYRFAKGFTVNLASSAGVVNMSNADGATYLNRITSIGVGYEFGPSK